MNLSEANDTFTSDAWSYFPLRATVLFTCNVLLGLPTNVYVVWQIASGAGGSVAPEIFALNLSVSEILFHILVLYVLLHFLLKMSIDVGIQVLLCGLQFMFISRSSFQSCICLERYLAVVHPTVFLRFKPLRHRLACCTVNWLLMLFYCLVPAFTLSTIHLVYLLVSLSSFFLVLMLYCGVHILCVLKQPGPGDGGLGHKSWNSMKRKAFKVILITLVFTNITHFIIVFILGPTLLFASQEIVMLITLLSWSINIVIGFITPLLYLHRAGKLPCIKF